MNFVDQSMSCRLVQLQLIIKYNFYYDSRKIISNLQFLQKMGLVLCTDN